MLTENIKATDFSLLDQDRKERRLSDYKNSRVLLYFYPKDDTPGCTKEACTITEVYDDFIDADVIVLGVSPDSPESHSKFRAKYNLPFTLLSDPDKGVIKEYDALGVLGVTKRISYLIDKGMIKKIYQNVDPASHALKILEDLKKEI